MTGFFNVAGHLFALVLPEPCTLWRYLGQYEPFRASGEGAEPLFTLELVRDAFTASPDRETVYDAPTEDGETVVRMYRTPDGWSVDMAPDKSVPCFAHLSLSPDYSRGTLYLDTRRINDAIFGINNSLMLMFAFRTAPLGTLELHASMVSNSGRAFLFLARSGTGKSTHSSLWLKHIPGSELMNDDNPVVRIWPDGRVIAYGSPWSGKTPCYRNVEAPVGAFVRIRRSPENKLERLGLLESYALLYSSSSGFKADRSMADGLHASLEAAVTTVPCYVLDCRPDEEAAKVCAAGVLKGEAE